MQSEMVPERFCNFDRLQETMAARGLDGIVVRMRLNVYYFSGFMAASSAANHEVDGYSAVILSRHAPDHPVIVVGEADAAYFLTYPSWVKDIRPYATMITSGLLTGLAGGETDPDVVKYGPIARYVPLDSGNREWVERLSGSYSASLVEGVRKAVHDLGLKSKRVGFDVLSFGNLVAAGVPIDVVDAHETVKYIRQVKTDAEIELIRKATLLNQDAIQNAVAAWTPGMTWRQLTHVYEVEATKLGGFVRDPGAVVVANSSGKSPSWWLESPREDFEVERGMHIMWDCHGTYQQYCWDGGKTWVVGGETNDRALKVADATAAAMENLQHVARGGQRMSDLQESTRAVFAKSLRDVGMNDAFVFFHGLGLTHIDTELTDTTEDILLEDGMVIAAHLEVPGDARTRNWLEQILVIGKDGSEPLYDWGYNLIQGETMRASR